MWQISGQESDRYDGVEDWLAGVPIPVAGIDGEPIASEQVRQLLQEAGGEDADWIRGTLWADAHADDPDPGLLPIEAWGPAVIEGEEDEILLASVDDGPPFALVSESPDGPTAVWHDMSIALVQIPAGFDTLQIQYDRHPADFERTGRMLGGLPGGRVADFVDWRFYVGEGTPAVDGESHATRVSELRSRGFIRLGRAAGTLIMRYANWRGPLRSPPGDPSWRRRVRRSERHFDEASQRFGVVTDADAGHDRCVIYVHGTMSSALPALHALRDVVGANVVRYEHDTFMPISHNAVELREQIQGCGLEPRVLHIVGHSRGGLVARHAAGLLAGASRPTPDRVLVHTFGSPHAGTPLVGQALDDATPLLTRAMLLTGLVADAIEGSWRDLASTAWTYLLRGKALPRGILEMAPGEPTLETIDALARGVSTFSYGGRSSLQTMPTNGKVAFLQSLGRGLFDADNDLVVSTPSALAAGKGTLLTEDCTHFGYFLNGQVLDVIADLD
jgi:hypothetical protein